MIYKNKANERAQWVETLATKTNDLSSVPGTPMGKGRELTNVSVMTRVCHTPRY